MEIDRKNIIYTLVLGILLVILADIGAILIRDFSEMPYLGIILILLAFLLVYFLDKIYNVGYNSDKIEALDERLEILESKAESDKKLLNTIRDIVILNKLKRRR